NTKINLSVFYQSPIMLSTRNGGKFEKQKSRAGTPADQYGECCGGAGRMAALSVYPIWESHNHTGRSRRGENNNGAADHSKADKMRACAAGKGRRRRTHRKGRRASQCDLPDRRRRAGRYYKAPSSGGRGRLF